jgi:hypothetical protein
MIHFVASTESNCFTTGENGEAAVPHVGAGRGVPAGSDQAWFD